MKLTHNDKWVAKKQREHQHPFRIVLSFLVASLLGLATIPYLSVDLNPNYDLPALTLSYSLASSSPDIVEQEATSVFENALSVLGNLNEIKSTSGYNRGSVTLLFDRETDMDYTKFEVRSILRNILPLLPKTLSYPEISQNTEEKTAVPLLVYRINGPFSSAYIKEIIDQDLVKSIRAIPGVDKVDVTGAVPMQINIELDKRKANVYQVTESDIISTLRKTFGRRFYGSIKAKNGFQYFIRGGNQPNNLHEIENIELKLLNKTPLLIKDVARVYFDEQIRQNYFRVNGLNSVALRIYGRKQQNRINLADQLMKHIAARAKKLPKSFELIKDYDDTTFLRSELQKIYFRAGMSILILSLFIFLIYRDIRSLTILLASIAVTLCLTLLVAWLFKINVHLYTIAGLTIAFGLIVDNAIVMVDHINRHKNTKIFLALLAATGTTIIALSVIYFLPEQDRLNLSEFGGIIIISLSMSLLVALWFTPALYQLLFANNPQNKHVTQQVLSANFFAKYHQILLFLRRKRSWLIVILILLFGLPVFMLPSRWEGHPWYNNIIGSDIYQDEIRPVTDKLLGGTLRLFVRNVFEKSGYRSNEQTRLYVNAKLPFGHSVEQMNTAIINIEEYLLKVKGLEKFVTSVYSGEHATIIITFDETHENSALPYQLKSRLISQSLDWGGVEWNIFGVGRGFSNSSGTDLPSYRVVMKGYNYDELERQANILAKKLLRHKRIQKVNTNERMNWEDESSTEVVIDFDRNRLGSQFQIATVAALLYENSYKPLANSYITLANKNTPLRITYAGAENLSTASLMQNPMWVNDSLQIDYATFARLAKRKTLNAIIKENRQYVRVVGFDYYGSDKFGSKYLEEVLKEMAKELPLGYEAQRQGWFWQWEKAKRNYGLLFIIALGIFFLCSVLFESVKQPFAILGVVPLSFIGLFITFAVFEFFFDQGGYAAFVLLSGLTVNAAIFVVYDLNAMHTGDYNENVSRAILGKAKPILLTITSTCFGLLPFLMEGQNEVFWFSLAAGTIGGLLVSVPIVFIVLPVWLMKNK